MIRACFRSLVPLLLLCALLVSEPASARPLHVVVSIKPIHSIVSGLMQGADNPELLVDGKASPFDYRLSDKQIASLKKADLIIWIGPEMESFLIKPLSQAGPDIRVIELLSLPDIKVLPHRTDNQRRDPWLWLDSRNALILLDVFTRLLIDLDPVRSHLYVRNRSKMLASLSRVDRELEYGYRGMKAGVGFLYYDTLQYFEQAYALKIRGALLDSPAQKPDTAKLLRAHAQINDGDYRCLLAEEDVSDEQLELLTGDTHINIGRLDSLGRRFPPGPDLYPALMRYNTRVIRQCLEIQGQKQVPAPVTASPDLTGHFILIDNHGRQISDQDMLGKYQLIYFGYTSCPDVCPMSLHVMLQALKKLGNQATVFQPYFITLDPQRDNTDVMNKYVNYFGSGLIGLTGTEAMIRTVAKQYRIRYEKIINDPKKPDDYQMDHTSGITIIDPQGRFVARLASNITPAQMARRLQELIESH